MKQKCYKITYHLPLCRQLPETHLLCRPVSFSMAASVLYCCSVAKLVLPELSRIDSCFLTFIQCFCDINICEKTCWMSVRNESTACESRKVNWQAMRTQVKMCAYAVSASHLFQLLTHGAIELRLSTCASLE